MRIYLMNNAKLHPDPISKDASRLFTARCYAECIMPQYVVRLSVCPSVHLSVTFRYRDNIGWNTSKIMSRLHRLRYLLGLTPTSAIWSNGNIPKISVE